MGTAPHSEPTPSKKPPPPMVRTTKPPLPKLRRTTGMFDDLGVMNVIVTGQPARQSEVAAEPQSMYERAVAQTDLAPVIAEPAGPDPIDALPDSDFDPAIYADDPRYVDRRVDPSDALPIDPTPSVLEAYLADHLDPGDALPNRIDPTDVEIEQYRADHLDPHDAIEEAVAEQTDTFVLKEGLLPPETRPSTIPLTQAERETRLGAIKIEVNEVYGRYKRHAERALQYALKMGALLIEAKAIVGHGGFMDWVRNNCPFSHPTADNYIYVASQNIESLRLMNLVEDGTVQRVEHYVHRRALRAQQTLQQQAHAEEAAERAVQEAERPKCLQRIYDARPRRSARAQAFTDAAPLRRAASAKRKAEAIAQGLPDLNTVRPHDDAAALLIEAQLPPTETENNISIRILVWLPEDAHSAAYAENLEDHPRAHGAAALKYAYGIIRQFDRGDPPRQRLEAEWEAIGKVWTDIQDLIIRHCRDATSIVRVVPIARDPLLIEMIRWWQRTLYYVNDDLMDLRYQLMDLRDESEDVVDDA